MQFSILGHWLTAFPTFIWARERELGVYCKLYNNKHMQIHYFLYTGHHITIYITCVVCHKTPLYQGNKSGTSALSNLHLSGFPWGIKVSATRRMKVMTDTAGVSLERHEYLLHRSESTVELSTVLTTISEIFWEVSNKIWLAKSVIEVSFQHYWMFLLIESFTKETDL